MGVNEIIEGIKQLPPKDQNAVADYVMDITGRSTPLSADKLESLASDLAKATNDTESEKIREDIHRGFYGKK